ncbi:MAG: recombinase family protein [Actinomycetota bacterium]
MNAVIYTRVSTKEQAEEGYSIAAQAEACRRLVTERGWTLIDEFVDRGESARTADRPQFQQMLERIRGDGSVQVLVVHKLDRLARNLEDHAAVRAMLRKAGVQLVSVTETLEDSASGKLVEGILASINEFYSANLSQEIRKGLNQKVSQGGWPGLAPVGYRNVRTTVAGKRTHAELEPDDQAHLVVFAFEQFATGSYTLETLTKLITEKGLRNRNGGPVHKSMIHRVLRNPVYIGKIAWKDVLYDGHHEPLVSPELFAKVQAMLDAHSTGGDRSWKHEHYLKGLFHCGECGSRLYYMVAKGRFGYFHCVGRNTGRKPCSQSAYLPAAKLERGVANLYRKIVIPPELEARVERMLETELAEREQHRAQSASFLSRRLRQLATEKDKLLRAYYADAIDVDTLKREQARISTETVAMEKELAGEGIRLEEMRAVIKTALRLAKNCVASYEKASPEVRKQWNRAFFKNITIKDGRMQRVTYEEPFAYLLGSHKRSMVALTGHYLNHGQ